MSPEEIPEGSDIRIVIGAMKNDTTNILKYISGEYQCAVAKAQVDANTRLVKAIETLVDKQGDIRRDVDTLQETVFGKEGDRNDTGLKGMVQSLVQEMRIIKWIGGVLAGTALAALATYWIQILLIHSGDLLK